jgi:cell division protein FtsN
MLRTGENETEILLGNKQLLGIFFVVAILLGAAFTGGYMLGRGPGGKKSAVLPAVDTSAANTATPANPSPGQTHSFPADSPDTATPATTASGGSVGGRPPKQAEADTESAGPPLGTPHTRREKIRSTDSQQGAGVKAESFNPQNGQEYLQVAAVGRDEAEAVADVLHKKGFHAHAVPKPGNVKIYRVIIGPIRDAGDLSSTRDALRRTGFREVIVQRY